MRPANVIVNASGTVTVKEYSALSLQKKKTLYVLLVVLHVLKNFCLKEAENFFLFSNLTGDASLPQKKRY